MRSVTTRVACYPPLFTALQLQPRALFSIAFQDAHQWFYEHLGVSLRGLLQHYQCGFVVHAVHLRYREPLRYVDADEVHTESTVHVRKDGLQLELRTAFSAAGRTAAELVLSAVPLSISETTAFSAVPAELSPRVLAKFRADEIDDSAYVCPIPDAIRRLREEGTLLGRRDTALVVQRDDCEFADQWYFAEVVRHLAANSEQIAFHAEDSRLRDRLSRPLAHLEIYYGRAAFLFDELVVSTEAYEGKEGELIFAHRVVPDGGQGAPYALALEHIERNP